MKDSPTVVVVFVLAVGVLAGGLAACFDHNENTNILGAPSAVVGVASASPAPAPTPVPGTSCVPRADLVASVTVGVLGGTAPGGASLPEGAGGNEIYVAPTGSQLTLNASPKDGAGRLLDCHPPASGWATTGSCTLHGATTGPTGFNPGLVVAAGVCDVTMTVEGVSRGLVAVQRVEGR